MCVMPVGLEARAGFWEPRLPVFRIRNMIGAEISVVIPAPTPILFLWRGVGRRMCRMGPVWLADWGEAPSITRRSIEPQTLTRIENKGAPGAAGPAGTLRAPREGPGAQAALPHFSLPSASSAITKARASRARTDPLIRPCSHANPFSRDSQSAGPDTSAWTTSCVFPRPRDDQALWEAALPASPVRQATLPPHPRAQRRRSPTPGPLLRL